MSTSLDPTFASFSPETVPSKSLVLVGGAWEYPATRDPYGVSIYLDIFDLSRYFGASWRR